MRIRHTLAALCLISIATAAFGALSKQVAEFASGPAQFLFTREERQQWEKLKTDEEANKFIELFWARRDPTPGTPHNEYHQMVLERARVADERFTQGRTPGSRTDKGRVFVVLGSPTKIRRMGVESVSTIQTPTGTQPEPPREMWEYEQAKSTLKLGQPKVEVAFMDQYQTNEWKMERVRGTDYTTVFERVASSYITQPNLTEVPVFTAAAGPVTSAAPTTIQTASLRDAIEQARTQKAAPEVLFLNFGEFVTPQGDHFVPVQLYLPRSAGVAAGADVTFFGAIDREEGGERVAAFEEAVKVAESKDGVYYARTLTLAPGRYVGTFGLARDGKPIAVVSQPMAVSGLDHATPGVSGLILTDNIYALTEPQRPTDPFAFGGLKVVPKGDKTFRPADELWYFVELRNPGVAEPAAAAVPVTGDAAAPAGQPKVQIKVDVEGTDASGKKIKMSAPPREVEAIAIKGVPNHYGVGSAIPLSSFKPGEYTMNVKVIDTVKKASYSYSEKFRVVE